MRHTARGTGIRFRKRPDPRPLAQFDALPQAKQDEYLTLNAQRRDDDDDEPTFEYLRDIYRRPDGARLSDLEAHKYTRVIVILWANQIGFLDAEQAEHRAVYLGTSRFNHQCAPNLLTNIKTNGEITLRARHRILVGAELTISYIHLDLLRAERRRKLLEDFGFECQCDLCDEEDLRPDAPAHEGRIATLQIYDMGETMRMYRENEFNMLPLTDANQLLKRCQKRWVQYAKLFWNDYSFYELLNIADLWARVWQLTPGNMPQGNPPSTNPRAVYCANEWRRMLAGAVNRLGPIVFDADDVHLADARRALASERPTIVQPSVPAPVEPVAKEKARTPEGRHVRSGTRSEEPMGSPQPRNPLKGAGAKGPGSQALCPPMGEVNCITCNNNDQRSAMFLKVSSQISS
ncbi:hypothetical protein PG994_005236 [Apiospora phragmitis]|uniref:SET domain-containing protein n=1 Tax=Apiospora phragmitis TaxID=2905665 RepID=A0ABR1VT52_9PEZI